VSIPSNVAEGVARGSKLERKRFLLIARGSLMEMDTQVWIAAELGWMTRSPELVAQMASVFRLMSGMLARQ